VDYHLLDSEGIIMNPGRAYNEGYIERDQLIAIGMQSAQRKLRVRREMEVFRPEALEKAEKEKEPAA
jgi:hypothetical protein